MSFDDLRPVVAGLLGALVAIALGRAMASWLPTGIEGKSKDVLLQENRPLIRIANGLFVSGFVAALIMYQGLGFADNDWRPLGIGLGVAFCAPLVALQVGALATGRRPQEALIAYAVSHHMPTVIMYAISAIGAVALIAAATSW